MHEATELMFTMCPLPRWIIAGRNSLVIHAAAKYGIVMSCTISSADVSVRNLHLPLP
jgi:hypothetical protein